MPRRACVLLPHCPPWGCRFQEPLCGRGPSLNSPGLDRLPDHPGQPSALVMPSSLCFRTGPREDQETGRSQRPAQGGTVLCDCSWASETTGTILFPPRPSHRNRETSRGRGLALFAHPPAFHQNSALTQSVGTQRAGFRPLQTPTLTRVWGVPAEFRWQETGAPGGMGWGAVWGAGLAAPEAGGLGGAAGNKMGLEIIIISNPP